ncbi:hypothetical protein ABZZ16_41945, partial [Streptomyces sp. NPDC006386]|uniref:hypothetical protein n=1 Tax=Streptomyces sp. NPDC006386 TaxID=3156762 RepID=UPI0033B3325B
MIIHPELRRAAGHARRPLLAAAALQGAVTLTHLAQAALLAVALAGLARATAVRCGSRTWWSARPGRA